MRLLILGLLITTSSFAQPSKVIPVFLEAVRSYINDPDASSNLVLRPDILAVIKKLEDAKIDPEFLRKYESLDPDAKWLVGADDKYDRWLNEPVSKTTEAPELALHSFKIDVIAQSDDVFKDDIYAYYFVTDGLVPTGKVTSIYKGIGHGQGFFFSEKDRVIFPLGFDAKKPDRHLIVDYGVIESDGDDIKKMQKLSSIIIDIVIAVYTARDPQAGEVLNSLRKEVKALADMLLSLNSDDRLIADTFGFKSAELAQLLEQDSYVEFTKKYKKTSHFDNWEYHVHFRLIRKD